MLFAIIHEIITLLIWYGCFVKYLHCCENWSHIFESFCDIPNKPIDIVLKEILEILGVFA